MLCRQDKLMCFTMASISEFVEYTIIYNEKASVFYRDNLSKVRLYILGKISSCVSQWQAFLNESNMPISEDKIS